MDGDGRSTWLLAVVLCILGAFYFAVTETAFASVSRNKIKTLAEKDNEKAKTALYILDHFDSAITTILICTNILHIAAASIVTVNVTRIWGLNAVSVSTIITTLAVFFFAEMLPKSIARKYSSKLSLATAGVLRFFMIALKPLAALLTWIGNGAAKLTKGDGEVSVTENELYDIIEDMTESGSLDEEQGDLISSALQFQDVTAESILTSRVDVVGIDVKMSTEEIIDIIKKGNHSRLPVYEGSLDHIIGILSIRKFVKAYLSGKPVKDITKIMEKPIFVHQSAKIDDLLNMMSKEKQNLAVVTDNYGGTLGIVSVEDILEELVGEIWDEDDSAQETFVKITDDLYSVDADDLVTDVLDELGVEYDEETEDELSNKLMSELAYEHFQEIPKEGDRFRYLNMEITVQIMKQNRIVRLKVKILPEEQEKEGEDK